MSASLRWNTYKTVGDGIAPVARIESERRYSFDLSGGFVGRPVSVKPFGRAWDFLGGEMIGAGNEIAASRIARGPVLLYPTETPDQPELLSLSRRRPKPDSLYWKPELLAGDEDLLSPEYDRARTGVLYAEGTPLGRGVYEVPPGYRQVVGIKVDQDRPLGRTSYDPRHGALYLETEDGVPIRSARVEVFLGRQSVMRRDLSSIPAGKYPIAPNETVRGVLEVETGRHVADARRLPKPEAGERWHAIDYGQTDGSPIAPASMWVIETEAGAAEVQEAVRRTLPAGSIYRIQRPS